MVPEPGSYQPVLGSFEMREQAIFQPAAHGCCRRRVDQVAQLTRIFAQVVQFIDSGWIETIFELRRADGADAEPETVVPFISIQGLVRGGPPAVTALHQRTQ